MLVVSRHRPKLSLATATCRSVWVSTPTVTCVGAGCGIVVMAVSLLCRGWTAPTGRAGGHDCDGSVATGSYEVTFARLVGTLRRPQHRSTDPLSRHPGRSMLGSDLAATAALGIIAIDVGPAAGEGQVVQDRPPLPLEGSEQSGGAP